MLSGCLRALQCVFGGVLGMVGGISPTLFPSGLGWGFFLNIIFVDLFSIALDKDAMVLD